MAKVAVLIEIENHGDDYLENTIALLESRGFQCDRTFKPKTFDHGQTVLIAGEVGEDGIIGLEVVRGVVQVLRVYDPTDSTKA